MEVQWNRLRALSDAAACRIELVVVDDHGTPAAQIPEDIRRRHPHQLIRLKKDVAWNQMGARNTGAHEARGRTFLFLDPDMIPQNFDDFLVESFDLHPDRVFKFCLARDHKGEPKIDTSSPNTWFIHRDAWAEIGGYNEDFAGNKGYSDVELLSVLEDWPNIEVVLRRDLLVDFLLPVQGYEDAQVQSAAGVNRDVDVNRAKHRKNLAEAKRRPYKSWSKWWREKQKKTKFLRVPYEVIQKR